ncbi:hypothetical protein GZ998_03540 [Actinomyces sp. 594]|uniref:hypothetical protein n=1 Tax=Actinomyces sp. 594 TaxID=2057793 RepID=UPI001C574F4E|nr:hypothetical protein [Actinomyces sp. 594]MBW3068587.1 hypothetical protein [Actinomyces sp. 594]
MSSYQEHEHPRGTDGKWTAKQAAPPAASLPGPAGRTLRIERRPRALTLSQPEINWFMARHGSELGPGDTVEVHDPASEATLPSTLATVVATGRGICRTQDDADGRFEARDKVRLIAHGHAHVLAGDAASVDLYDDAHADLVDAAEASVLGRRATVHAGPGTTVYAWAGIVRADDGAQVWIMRPGVTVQAAPGAMVGDGEDSPVAKEARPIEGDVFARHRRNAEEGVYDREPLYDLNGQYW